MACQRRGGRPSKRVWVSLSRKLLIIDFIIYRYSIYRKPGGGLTPLIPPVSILSRKAQRRWAAMDPSLISSLRKRGEPWNTQRAMRASGENQNRIGRSRGY